jgi:chemosensory pili system protein ChpA (sensor histidine kinase/response regulator)
MSERQDYIALDWVAGEIGETLKQASQALEAYVANRDDVTKLRFCLTHIHQVHGILQMVEFFGAALLAEEMESLVHDLTQGAIHNSHIDDALNVLQNAIVQLPLYLQNVKKRRHGLPATLLPVLNDLRAVRGKSLLSETVLFSPDIPAEIGKLDSAEIKIAVGEITDVAQKLRQMFQIALLGLIRGNDIKKNLNYLAKVCARLAKLTEGFPQQQLWRICIAALEGMLNGSIESSVAVKILLRQVDRQIKLFIDKGEAAFEKAAPEDLIKNLLYYVARSKASSRFINEIRAEYKLDNSLLGEGDLSDEDLAAPDNNTIHSVVEALVHELQSIQLAFQQAGDEPFRLAEILPLFKRVSDTMAILGLGSALKLLQEPYSQLAKLLATQSEISTQQLDEITHQLTLAESELKQSGVIDDKQQDELFNDSDEAQEQLDRAFESVAQESRKSLEQAKESIVEFVATKWDHECLLELPALLAEISGSLNMVPLTRAANILKACESYVSQTLLADNAIPEWQMLDTLADAITSIDYYLERLVDDEASEGDAILEVAEESVAELGYAVTELSEISKPSTEDAELDVSSHLPIIDSISEEEKNLEPPILSEMVDDSDGNEGLSDSHLEPIAVDENLEKNIESSVDAEVQNESVSVEADEDFDPEIVEIFVEEAAEVLETINEYTPQWIANTDDKELGSTVRRAFHTLKGSGRMVGATDVGELAWSIENMLNKVQDGSLVIDQQRFDLVNEAALLVPNMVAAFEKRQPVDMTVPNLIIAKASALAKEQSPEAAEQASDDHNLLEEIPVVTDVHHEPSVEVGDEIDDEVDAELQEIFASETAVHDQVLDDFIARCHELAGPAEFTDELQRALHTLKGSANMAGIIPVAKVVTPLEYVVKELRASQLKVDEPLLALLERGSQLIKEGIKQLAVSPLQELTGADDFEKDLMALLNERISQIDESDSEDGGIAPEALNTFLTESLDLITEMSGKLMLWQQGEINGDESDQLQLLVGRFVQNAVSVNMLAPIELGESLQAFYRRSSGVQQPLDGSYFVLANEANDGLVDMLDQIAGHQIPVLNTDLYNRIEDYEFITAVDDAELAGINSEQEDSEVVSIDNNIDETLLADIEESNQDLKDTVTMPIVDIGEIEGEYVDFDNLDFESLGEQLKAADTSAAATDDELPENELSIEAETEDQLDAKADDVAIPAFETFSSQEGAANSKAEDEDFDEEIIEIFLEEADDLLENLDESLHAWTDDRDNHSYLADLLRILHTLKGGARLAGLVAIGDLSHDFETLLTGFEQQSVTVDDKTLYDIQNYQDQLVAHVNAIKSGEPLAYEAPLPEAEIDDSVIDLEQNEDQESLDVNDDPAERLEDEVSSEPELSDEDVFEEIEKDSVELTAEDVDEIISLHEEVSDEPNVEIDQEVIEQLSATDDSVDESIDVDFDHIDSKESLEPIDEDSPQPNEKTIVPVTEQRPREVSPIEIDTPLIDAAARKAPQEVVKVSAQLLEELVNLAGETSISRGRAEEQISELVFSLDEMQVTVDRLQEQVRRLDMETEQQILYRQEQVESEGLEGFDPLEMDRYSQLQQLSRSLLESSSDLVDIKSTLSDKSRDMETLLIQQSRINTDLQEGLMRSRMVPFSRMVPRLRRIVRQISSELNKQVDLHLRNVEGELDRTVLERMISPLEHMLRNAVDHGIESEERRLSEGKSARGNISLDLSREGGEIVLVLSDDGGGIDLEAVKSKAIERNLIDADADLTDREITQFILQSGFSTATEVTQISGRGVGMDVVHSEIKQLGGSMDIDTRLGKGSSFTVRLPFTVSVNRALMVNVGGDSYAIPLNTIEGIVRVSPFELEAYYQPDAPMFEYAGQPYLLRYMGALLQRGDKPILEGQSMPLPVVLVRGAEHSVAIQVDSLMGSREIVVKPLGPQFGQVQGLSGATVLGDGSVVVILDLLAMIRADATHVHRYLDHTNDNALEQSQNVLVMVVDDSVTVRKVTSRFLERQGMDVLLAKDGVDAVTQLQEIERIPDVMLLDIEMPRMDGFEVANRVRHNSRLKDMPIIMITSRTGEKHRERALSLGVNEYLGKPFQESVLLETIQSLTGETQGN